MVIFWKLDVKTVQQPTKTCKVTHTKHIPKLLKMGNKLDARNANSHWDLTSCSLMISTVNRSIDRIQSVNS